MSVKIIKLPVGDVPAAQHLVNRMVEYEGAKHPVLKDLRRDVFYGGQVWAAVDATGLPLSVHCTKLGKRKKNAWEPYANWYTAYTLEDLRRRGLAQALYRAMEAEALAAGCRRVKSLAGSREGLHLHNALDHHCWGYTPNDEVYVDSPLMGFENMYADMGAPAQAPGPRMGPSGIAAALKNGLRYDKI